MREDYVDTHLSPDYKPEWSDLSFAGSATVAPGDTFDRHYHDGPEYWLVSGGRAMLAVGDDQFEVGRGDIIATPPGVEHDIVAVDPNQPLELFYLGTAVQPGGEQGQLHRGDAYEHQVGELS